MWWSRSVPLSTAPQSSVCVTRKVHVRDLEPTTRGKAVLRLFAGCDIYFRFRFFLLLGQARNSAASQRPESRRNSLTAHTTAPCTWHSQRCCTRVNSTAPSVPSPGCQHARDLRECARDPESRTRAAAQRTVLGVQRSWRTRAAMMKTVKQVLSSLNPGAKTKRTPGKENTKRLLSPSGKAHKHGVSLHLAHPRTLLAPPVPDGCCVSRRAGGLHACSHMRASGIMCQHPRLCLGGLAWSLRVGRGPASTVACVCKVSVTH